MTSQFSICPNCSLGRLQPLQTMYARVYNGTLVHIPNVPAWTCDVCGQTYYDEPTIRRVELMIGEAGPPPNQHIEPPPMPPAEPRPASTEEPAADSRPD